MAVALVCFTACGQRRGGVRGYIKPGYFADITVFDEAEMKDAVPDQEKAFGIKRVFINGHQVLAEGALDKDALKTSGHALPRRPVR